MNINGHLIFLQPTSKQTFQKVMFVSPPLQHNKHYYKKNTIGDSRNREGLLKPSPFLFFEIKIKRKREIRKCKNFRKGSTQNPPKKQAFVRVLRTSLVKILKQACNTTLSATCPLNRREKSSTDTQKRNLFHHFCQNTQSFSPSGNFSPHKISVI